MTTTRDKSSSSDAPLPVVQPPQEPSRILAQKHAARLRREMCCPKDDPVFGPVYCTACMDRDQIATILEAVAAPVRAPHPTADDVLRVAEGILCAPNSDAAVVWAVEEIEK